MVKEDLLSSAHDCAEGGLACTLAEAALGDGEHSFGIDVTLADEIAPVPLLFGETQGRVVVSCRPDRLAHVAELAASHDMPCAQIGQVGAPVGSFRIRAGTSGVDVPVRELADTFFGAIPALMDSPDEATQAPDAS